MEISSMKYHGNGPPVYIVFFCLESSQKSAGFFLLNIDLLSIFLNNYSCVRPDRKAGMFTSSPIQLSDSPLLGKQEEQESVRSVAHRQINNTACYIYMFGRGRNQQPCTWQRKHCDSLSLIRRLVDKSADRLVFSNFNVMYF